MSIGPVFGLRKVPALLAALGALHVASPARGEEPAAPLRLSLREAVRRGAERGPDIAVARAPTAALEEARRAAGTVFPSPPRVGLAAGGRHGPAGDGPELTVSVTQDLSLHGLSGARQKLAGSLAEVTRLDVKSAEHRSAERAALAWVELAEATRVLALREEAVGQAEALLKLADARVKSGVADPLEGELGRSELSLARVAELDAEGMVFEAGASLRYAVGLGPSALVATDGDVEALEEQQVDEAAALARADRDHPALQGLAARREAARDEAALALAAQAPSLGVGAAYTREGTGDQIWTAVVTIPLPLAHPGAFDAARSRAAAATHEAELGRARAELARETHLLVHEREHARELFQALGGLLGPSREALRLATAQLGAGTLDIGRVLQARARVIAASEQRARAAADALRADLRLEALQGTLITRVGR